MAPFSILLDNVTREEIYDMLHSCAEHTYICVGAYALQPFVSIL